MAPNTTNFHGLSLLVIMEAFSQKPKTFEVESCKVAVTASYTWSLNIYKYPI